MSNRRERRRQRREYHKLGAALDWMTLNDRTFFQTHPGRRYRIRLAMPVEHQEFKIANGHPIPVPPGGKAFIAVKKINADTRARLYFAAIPPTADADGSELDDRWAEHTFETLAAGGTP